MIASFFANNFGYLFFNCLVGARWRMDSNIMDSNGVFRETGRDLVDAPFVMSLIWVRKAQLSNNKPHRV